MRRRIRLWEVTILVAVALTASTAMAQAPSAAGRYEQMESRTRVLTDVVAETVIPQIEENLRRINDLTNQVNRLQRQLIDQQQELRTLRTIRERPPPEFGNELARLRQLNRDLERRVAALEAARREPTYSLSAEQRVRLTPAVARQLNGYTWPRSAGSGIR